MAHGFDPLELPADRFFNWVWREVTRNMDEKKLREFTMDVHRPLPGQAPDTSVGPWSDEAMAESFMTLAGQMGGLPGTSGGGE